MSDPGSLGSLSGWAAWATVIAAGLVTLVIRASFIILPADTRVPTWLTGGLKYVAAAVLPALIVPDVLFRELAPGDVLNTYRVIAAAVAMAFALKTKSTFGTLVVGMAVLWLLKWWAPF